MARVNNPRRFTIYAGADLECGGVLLLLPSYPPKGEIPFPGLSWPVSQVVKTPPFHDGNAGSIPARATKATKEGTKIQQGASPYEETAWPSMLKWME